LRFNVSFGILEVAIAVGHWETCRSFGLHYKRTEKGRWRW